MGDSFEIFTVSSGDIAMDCARIGSGKRVFLMLPGLSLTPVTASTAAVAAAYAPALDDYTIYLFDRRKDAPQGYTCEQMADDTVQMMEHLGISDAHVFGVSQGGMIAQCIGVYHPQYAKKILLASTSARSSEAANAVFERWIAFAEAHDRRELNRDFARSIYTPELVTRMADVFAAMEEQGTDEQLAQFVIFSQACMSFDIYDKLDGIKCPTMVIGAENDRVLTAQASVEMAEKIGCECYIYPHYGHAVYDEAPDYLKRVLEFFDR